MKSRNLLWVLVFALGGCAGDPGPSGPAGPAGSNGTDGTDGTDGVDWPGEPPAAYLAADAAAGGAAYSQWWTTEAGGSGTQPATTAPADFYRCKACHAWDGLGNAGSYSNRTGQSTGAANRPDVSWVNLRSTTRSESYQELFDLVRHSGARNIDAADNTHPDYSTRLSDSQVWNIVKFMREGWVDPSLLYSLVVSGPAMHWDYSVDPPVLVKPTLTYSNIGGLGNEANGRTLYESRCTLCHGSDGTSLEIEGQSLGQFARAKPNEAWFKMKFGQPGTGMNPGLVTSTSDLQDLYKALANAGNFPDLP
jgi:mono/diheme cytochrome c family protein